MYTLRLRIKELVSWLMDSAEEQAPDATDQGPKKLSTLNLIGAAKILSEPLLWIQNSLLSGTFCLTCEYLPLYPAHSADPMSEVIDLRLYYESSLEEDRLLLATCNFAVGELLKACWLWNQVELHLAGQEEVCAKLSANLSISTKFREDPQNLDREIEHHRKALGLRATPHPECAVTLYNLANALQARFIQRGNDGDNDAAIEYYRAAVQDAPTHPASLLKEFVFSLHKRFELHGNLKDVNEAIGITEELLGTRPEQRRINLINLAQLLEVRFKHQPTALRDPNDIEKIIVLCREALGLQDNQDSTILLEKLAFALHQRFKLHGDIKDVNEAIGIAEELLGTRPEQRRINLINLVQLLEVRFKHQPTALRDPNDIDKIIVLRREALGLQDNQDSTSLLDKLVFALHQRFELHGDIEDVNEAIGITEELLGAHSAPHPQRFIDLVNLAQLLEVRFEHQPTALEDPNDIDKIIVFRREISGLQDDSYEQSKTLNLLGAALRARFAMRQDLNDLEDAIKCHREALAINSTLVSQPKRAGILANLAIAVHMRFRQHGDPKDLDELIELWREELQLTDQDPKRWKTFRDLGRVLEVRFDQRGDPNDLNESITLRKEALKLSSSPDSDRSEILHEVDLSLRRRFEHGENISDLDDAIALCREDLANCSHSELRHCLRNLADVLQMRFDHQRHTRDIDEAIKLYRRVPGNDDDTATLNNLSGAVQARFQQQGNPADIDEAIELCRKSLLLSSLSQSNRPRLSVNLGMALRTRFSQRGNARDLDEAIELHRQALQSQRTNDPDHSIILSNLADVLQLRFRERGRKRDIDEAIDLYGEAINTRSRHYQNRSTVIHNLAHALELRFQAAGELGDINNAIDHYNQALQIRMPPNPRRRSSLNGLAVALTDRFHQQHDAQDIDKAIGLCQEAFNSCPDSHPDRVRYLRNLGNCICYGAELRESPNNAVAMGISNLQEASTCAYSVALDRFSAATNWTKWATEYKHPSALDAYRARIHILPELAALSLNLKSRQEMLSKREITSLSSTSATCAIGLEAYNVAVEFLEASRSIFWSQALNLRSAVDDLASVSSDLAMNLRALSRQLEHASFRETAEDSSSVTHSQLMSAEAETTRCRKLNQDWEETIKVVRMLPGFEDFLRPKNIVSIRQAALSGPVVILLVTGSSSSALVVKPSEDVQHVPLPAINMEKLKLYSRLPRAILNQNPTIIKSERNRHWNLDSTARLEMEREDFINQNPDDILRTHLAELWDKLVKPVFRALGLQKSKNPPRLWWCPTGMFTFLPIHAAGTYDADGTDCVSDYVVSSYTPTLTALLNRPTAAKTEFKMTAVIEPNAPNCPRLPGTVKELVNIAKRVPKEWLTAICSGTRREVMDHLRGSSVAHFACHGTQDQRNPLDSGLMLSDGRLKVSQIMEQLGHDKSRTPMSLAFLSACETAKGDNITPDEAMHVAATLLFAGFHAVVATMWTIDDNDGPEVADTFYEYLFKDCTPHGNSSALHFSIAKLRKEPGMSFKRWVPFVHYGL
ncbi:CHAT domain-containing protein [Mycena rosella]|uniref:CHAT domain-containing protein n=1 Tax=Mycena rosella TaxID=1033263 RepID=A0AAD7GFW1_MYCRO|nr:CHAT domain-containing protein [Mycena rosella]